MQHPDEQQILSLLRETIAQSGLSVGDLEQEIGWEPGRLGNTLSGHGSVSLRDLFGILAALEVGTADFFGRAYGLEPREVALLPAEHVPELRFEESHRVIREALTRRSVWKKERAEL